METSTLIQKWISMKFSSNLFQIKPYLRLNTRVNWCKSRSSREITENLWLSKYFLGINSSSYIAPACKDGGASSLFLSPTRPSMLFFAVSCGCLKVRLCNADAADPLAFSRLVFRAFLRVASWRKKRKGKHAHRGNCCARVPPFFMESRFTARRRGRVTERTYPISVATIGVYIVKVGVVTGHA